MTGLRVLQVAVAALMALGTCGGQDWKFEDYVVKTARAGAGKPVRFATAGQREFRTRILEGVRKGPNFAGHYAIVQWGCGAGCVSMVVADIDTGILYEGPFGPLPSARLAMPADLPPDQSGLFFRPNSRLLLANGCPNEKNCGRYAYEWDGKAFRRLGK